MATQTVAASVKRPASTRGSGSSGSIYSSTPRTSRDGRFAPGTILAGRYRIVALLGRGGMGEVYRADDLTLDQPVALKFLPESLSSSESAIERFRNEVRLARQVAHPNVCRVYDLGEIEGLYFLSMEYVDGEDLGSLVRRIGRLPTDKALEISRKLCAGLSAAHERGVLHRDLKPANVMLDGQGQVRLTDFGLAGMSGSIEGDEVRSGTPAYMAPEQMSGAEVTPRSDIYSLGLVLYEIFTGKLPFESDTLAGLLKARTETSPEPPSSLVRDLDPLVERAILRCLQAKPEDRPPSALAVAAALPGGNALEAALAAGELPSLHMLAAAGAGEGLHVRTAFALAGVIIVCLGIAAYLEARSSMLERVNPQLAPDVLVQKARDIIGRAGGGAAVDSAYDFAWASSYVNYAAEHGKPRPDWQKIGQERPSPLQFWYRQAASPLTALTFHTDLLTPGQTDDEDPPPTEAGMAMVRLDDAGRLLYFQRMPPEVLSPQNEEVKPIDWAPMFNAASLDAAQLKSTEPLWTFLAASDTRAAWTGVWPGTSLPLRVEAAGFRGKPVVFSLIGAWTPHPRAPDTGASGGQLAAIIILSVIVVLVCTIAVLLARKNVRAKRVDIAGSLRLATFMFWVHMAVWAFRSHFNASIGTFAMFLIALATSLFGAALIWVLYAALEPYVRRRWPQTLIGGSAILTGRFRDVVVGRDVLIGIAMGAALFALDRVVDALAGAASRPDTCSTAQLLGFRDVIGDIVRQIPSAVRSGLIFLFLIFLLRSVFRNQWLACLAAGAVFGTINVVQGQQLSDIVAAYLICAMLSVALVKWGLVPTATLLFTINTLGSVPYSTHFSSWYAPSGAIVIAAFLVFAGWAFRTATAGQKFWQGDLLE